VGKLGWGGRKGERWRGVGGRGVNVAGGCKEGMGVEIDAKREMN